MIEPATVAAGQISQFFGANPIVTFASGITAALATLAILVRLWKSTGPADAYVQALAARVKVLEERDQATQADRQALASKLAAAEATLTALQQRLATVEMENQRLRDQNANQELRLAECDREARAAQGKIVALERHVRDLESRLQAQGSFPGEGMSE